MEALSALVPSVRCRDADAPPLHVPSAVLHGTLRYFNHHNSKWVLGFESCRLYTLKGTADVGRLKLVLLRREGAPHRLASSFTYGCLQGPPGSTPFVLTPPLAPPMLNAGVGWYVHATSKQRRFRIDASDCVLVVGGVALRLETLHVEATYA